MSTEITGRPFDCSRLKEILPDYLDSDLQSKVCAEIKAHLEECEDCRIFVKTVETTIVLYKHCPENDVPEEIRIDLRRRLRTTMEKKGSPEGS